MGLLVSRYRFEAGPPSGEEIVALLRERAGLPVKLRRLAPGDAGLVTPREEVDLYWQGADIELEYPLETGAFFFHHVHGVLRALGGVRVGIGQDRSPMADSAPPFSLRPWRELSLRERLKHRRWLLFEVLSGALGALGLLLGAVGLLAGWRGAQRAGAALAALAVGMLALAWISLARRYHRA